MEKLKIYNSFKFSKFIKFFFIITISLFLFLSFRNSIYFSNNKIIYLITFLFFQSLIITNIFYKKAIFYNLNIIIILNLLITPFFFNLTFDVPYRHPNTKKELIWPKNLNNGFEFKKHIISTDSQGNRVNKKVDYSSKKESTFRVFAIGASTTEEEGLDDSLIWTNRLIQKLRKDNSFNKEDYEIINFGIGGLRSIHHYFTVKKNLKLKPDLLIFLIGVNDWNYQIINIEENFLYSEFEIAFDFRSSLFHKVANQIYKQIKKKIVIINPADEKKIETKENNSFKNTNPYLNLIKKESLSKKNIQSFSKVNLRKVSVRYDYWLKKIVTICNKKKLNCLFVDQPTLYYISSETNLDRNLWMNPPFMNYKISSTDMLKIANLYNSYLKKNTNNDNVKFCEISKKINPNKEFFLDDVHFTPKGSLNVANELYDCIKKF